MKSKRKKNENQSSWIIVSLLLTVFMIVAYFYIRTDKTFDVVYSSASQIPGYEASPESARIYASPAIKADETSPILNVLGWVMLAAVVFSCWWAGTDRHLSKDLYNDKADSTKARVAITLPLILAAVFWFAGYSASLDRGSLVTTIEDLRNNYKVPSQVIEQIRTNDVKNIKDESGLITEYFVK